MDYLQFFHGNVRDSERRRQTGDLSMSIDQGPEITSKRESHWMRRYGESAACMIKVLFIAIGNSSSAISGFKSRGDCRDFFY